MELNILKITVDKAGRVTESKNLSVNQCSDNNRLTVYYDGEYDYIECSFRKPDGWLSDRLTLTFDVDEELFKYAYVDIPEEFVTFPMGGRNAILVGNVYFHKSGKTASLGNIRINVNEVPDADVHTNYSEAYMHNINSQIGALQNDLNRFKTGDVLVGKAISDQHGNEIDKFYETKADASDKYDDLNQKKLDKSEVQDQTNRLEILETNAVTSNDRITLVEDKLDSKDSQVEKNTTDIDELNNTKVSLEDFEKFINERVIAENNLQKQIDHVAASQTVVDIVGTRAELFAYDINKLEVGDRIQVLTDVAYDNLSTIYRWIGPTGRDWEFVGKYSSLSYSKAESDAITTELRSIIPNRMLPENNSIYLYKDSTKINQTTPVTFKTINGSSIIGKGDILTDNTDAAFSSTSTNPVQNKLITAALANKADKTEIVKLETSIGSKADTSELAKKQDKLKAGANVTISNDGTISVSTAIKFSKVDSLPTTGESNIIYLLKTFEDFYTEYVWVDGRWEVLGDARLNLDNYYTANEINEIVATRAYQSDLESLASKVSANTVSISSKADATLTNTMLTLIAQDVAGLQSTVSGKADSSELENYALITEIPDVSTKQDKLKSGENIKTINGIDILGSGDLLIADTEIIDLGKYVLKTENQELLALKADKTELFNRDYNSLNNLPNLDAFATSADLTNLRNAVNQQIESLPKPDMTQYYTKEEVDTAIENVDVTEQLNNYYTKEEVDSAIDNVDVTDQLVDYAQKSWVSEQGYLKILDAADRFAVKNDIPTVPGVVSAFANDAGYSTKDYVDEEIEKVEDSISKLIGGAPEAYDTLKELADYISSDQTETSNILASITANRNKIDTVEGKIASSASEALANAMVYSDNNLSSAKVYTDNSFTIARNYTDTEITKNVTAVNSTITTSLNTAKTYTDTEINKVKNTIKDSNDSTLDSAKEYTDVEIDKVEILLNTNNASVLESAKAYTDSEIANIIGTAPEAYDTLKEIAEYIESDKSGASAMLGSINQNASNILAVSNRLDTEISNRASEVATLTTNLNAEITNRQLEDSKTLNSAKLYTDAEIVKVEQTVSDLISGADETLETIREIIDYIESDKTGASAMLTAINTNAANIEKKVLFKNWAV